MLSFAITHRPKNSQVNVISFLMLQAGISAAPTRALTAVKNMNLPQQLKDIKLPELPQAIKDLKL